MCVFLLAAATVCYADSSEEGDDKHGKDKLKCIENYLKSKQLLDADFQTKLPESDGSAIECDAFVLNFNKEFYDELKTTFETDPELADVTQCIIDNLKKSQLVELSMKLAMYQVVAKLSPKKRKKAIKAIEYTIEKRLENAAMVCHSAKTFGAMFDQMYNAEDEGNDTEDKKLDDYCTRKHLIDNNFIDSTIYTVDLNPSHVDITGVDCVERVQNSKADVFNAFKEAFEDETAKSLKRQQKCLTKASNSFHYFEDMAKVVLLGEVKISPERYVIEKQLFIDSLKNIHEIAAEC